MFVCLLQKNTVKTLFGGVITNNVVSLVSLRTFSLPLTVIVGLFDVCCCSCRTVTTSVRPRRSFTPSDVRWPT